MNDNDAILNSVDVVVKVEVELGNKIRNVLKIRKNEQDLKNELNSGLFGVLIVTLPNRIKLLLSLSNTMLSCLNVKTNCFIGMSVGFAVSCHSGRRLAMTLVNCYFHHFFL